MNNKSHWKKYFLAFILVGIILLGFVPFSSASNELETWNQLKNSYKVQDYEDFLFLYPNGNYSSLALQRIEQIQRLKQTGVKQKDLIIQSGKEICELCGGWSNEKLNLKMLLVKDNTARIEQRFPKSDVSCVSEYMKWELRGYEIVFSEGKTVCSDRRMFNHEKKLVKPFVIEGRNKLILKGKEQIVYKRRYDIQIKSLHFGKLPLLCISEECLRMGFNECAESKVQFQCIEYAFQGITCESFLGSPWETFPFNAKGTPPNNLVECQKLCKTTALTQSDSSTQIQCLTP